MIEHKVKNTLHQKKIIKNHVKQTHPNNRRMTEQRKRGRPKKDPNAPKSNYYYSFAVKARKQSQKRLRDAEKRAAKATKQAEDKRHYAKKLKEKITKVDKALRENTESTLIDKEDLHGLPNAVEQLVDGREIIFQPNEGPQ